MKPYANPINNLKNPANNNPVNDLANNTSSKYSNKYSTNYSNNHSNVKSENPFQPLGTVSPGSFFNRHAEIDTAFSYLESTVPLHFIVTGKEGIGKSSFLRKVEHIAIGRGFACSRASAAHVNTPVDFAQLLVTMLRLALEQRLEQKSGIAESAQAENVILHSLHSQNFDETMLALRLAEAISNSSGQAEKVFLAIDDAENLFSQCSGFASFVCSRLQELNAPTCIGFASAEIPQNFNAAIISLETFSKDNSQALIKARLESTSKTTGLSASKEAIELIAESSMGIPKILQTICFQLFISQPKITTDDVKSYLSHSFPNSITSSQFSSKISDLGKVERSLLQSIPNDDFTPTSLSKKIDKPLPWIAPKLASLVRKGLVLKKSRGIYQISKSILYSIAIDSKKSEISDNKKAMIKRGVSRE